jgi:hypothetical protein
MNALKRIVSVVGVMTLVVLSIAVIAPKTSHAVAAAFVQIVPGSTSHIGQAEGQMVALDCRTPDPCVSLSPSAGDTGESSFVVPSGYTLVITDFQFLQFNDSPNINACDQLLIRNSTSQSFYSPTLICEKADSTGLVERDVHFTTGVRVASGASLRNYTDNSEATVLGYLIPN